MSWESNGEPAGPRAQGQAHDRGGRDPPLADEDAGPGRLGAQGYLADAGDQARLDADGGSGTDENPRLPVLGESVVGGVLVRCIDGAPAEQIELPDFGLAQRDVAAALS